MSKITEIIPDDMPEWAREAMEEGQLFRECLRRATDIGWISVEDRLPEEGNRYWCYVEEINDLGKSHYQWNCSYSPEEGFNTEYKNSPQDGYVTHWMPLPEPPNDNA